MAETKTIKDFVKIETPLLDEWLNCCNTVKQAIKSHALKRDTIKDVPDCDELTEELTNGYSALTTERSSHILNLPDDLSEGGEGTNEAMNEALITIEFQDMALKQLIAARQLGSHNEWSPEDV